MHETKDYPDWGLEEANAAIGDAIDEMPGGDDAFEANQAFVEDQDHWQDGDGWVGPDGGSNSELNTLILAAVERQFTPVDAIGEVLARMANALLQREADVDFVPLDPPKEGSDEEQALADEATELKAVVAHWWDRVKLWERAREAVKRSRWAQRGALRTWIPPGHLEAGTAADEGLGEAMTTVLPSGLELDEALRRVELSAPQPDHVTVYTDLETQRKCAVFLYSDGDQDRAELWYLDGDKTVLRIVGDEGEGPEFRVDLGDRLPIAEMEGELLITDAVRRQQKRLNFFESLLLRVGEAAGFPERYTLNAESSGVWLQTPPSGGPALKTFEDHSGTTWYLHSTPRTLGAAITTELVGIVRKADDGGEERANPGVVFKEPTSPEYATKAATHAHRTILKQCRQGHLATDSAAEASGVAYEQARADFEDDLNDVKGPLEGMLRDTIEAAISWAEAMGPRSTEGRILDRFRVVVTLNVKSGPISPDAQNQNNANVKAGTLSQESAMAANGVEDVDAELAKIRAQPEVMMDLRSKQVGTILDLVREGATFEQAAQRVGIDDEDDLAGWREMDAAAEERRAEEAAQDDEIDQVLAGTAAGVA